MNLSSLGLSPARRYYLNLVLVDEEERRYFKQQEITLWRKGERVRKLPAAGALYQQQQHALARHCAGDQPTQGVRTAPTPSQPPTPYAEGEKPLPGVEEEEEQVQEAEEEVGELVEETQEKCVLSDPEPSGTVVANPPDLVSQVPPAPSSPTLDAEDAKDETDSLADLDIVAVSGDLREADMTTPPDLDLDSPPEMPDTAEDSPSPDISLPDAPSSEPGSPELKVY